MCSTPSHHPPTEEDSNARIVIKRVPWGSTAYELNGFIRLICGHRPTAIEFRYRQDGGSSRVAFVDFATLSQAARALCALHSQKFMNGRLHVEYFRPRRTPVAMLMDSQSLAAQNLQHLPSAQPVRFPGPTVKPPIHHSARPVRQLPYQTQYIHPVPTATIHADTATSTVVSNQLPPQQPLATPTSSLQCTPAMAIHPNQPTATTPPEKPHYTDHDIHLLTRLCKSLAAIDLDLGNRHKHKRDHLEQGDRELLALSTQIEEWKSLRGEQSTVLSRDLLDETNIRNYEWNENIERKIARLELKFDKILLETKWRGSKEDKERLLGAVRARMEVLDGYCEESARAKAERVLEEMKSEGEADEKVADEQQGVSRSEVLGGGLLGGMGG